MTDHPCIIKAFGGCRCEDGECAEKPVLVAPVILPSWRTHLAVCLFVGFAMTFVSAAVMEGKMKAHDVDCQEACVSWQR